MNLIHHDRRLVNIAESADREAVIIEDVAVDSFTIRIIAAGVVRIGLFLIPRNAACGRLMFMDTAQRMTKLMNDDTRKFHVWGGISQPTKIHGWLICWNCKVLCTNVGPGTSIVVDVDTNFGISRVDKDKLHARIIVLFFSVLFNLGLDLVGTVQDSHTKLAAVSPHGSNRDCKCQGALSTRDCVTGRELMAILWVLLYGQHIGLGLKLRLDGHSDTHIDRHDEWR